MREGHSSVQFSSLQELRFIPLVHVRVLAEFSLLLMCVVLPALDFLCRCWLGCLRLESPSFHQKQVKLNYTLFISISFGLSEPFVLLVSFPNTFLSSPLW